jgi:hypothetical protein
MVVSTRTNDYNDPPSLQNQGDGKQRNNPPHDAQGAQAFNLEVEFHKLQGLVEAQAAELAILRKERKQCLKGKKR